MLDLQLANDLDIAIDAYISREQPAYAQAFAKDAFMSGSLGKVYPGLQRAAMALNNKEIRNLWGQPNNVGNTGGPSARAHGTFTWTPGETGIFTCQAAMPNIEDNFYYMMPLDVNPDREPNWFVDSRLFRIVDLSGWQALEWQFQRTGADLITHNCAYQLSIPSKQVRYFKYTNPQAWIPIPSIPFPDLTLPLSIQGEFRTGKDITTHVSLTLNGKKYDVGVTQPANDERRNLPKLTIAFQVDPNKLGKVCSLQVGDTELRAA